MNRAQRRKLERKLHTTILPDRYSTGRFDLGGTVYYRSPKGVIINLEKVVDQIKAIKKEAEEVTDEFVDQD